MIQAVILAGGKGTRMKSLTKNTPKPMLKIGGLPILAHQVELLRRYGIKDIVILTHHLSEAIEEYFKDGKDFGVKISYFKERKPLGTTGGIKEIEDKLKKDFIIVYGDVMVNMDIARLLRFHRGKKSIATLVLHPNDHPQDSDLVEVDESQKIIAFHPKPRPENEPLRNLVNAGLYVISPKVLKHIKKWVKADFGKDLFPKMVKKERLYGYVTAEYLKDMGTPKRLAEVKKDYQSGKINRLNRKNKRRAVFLDRDGVINKADSDICRINDFKLFPQTAQAIRKINESEFLAIVATNQPAIAKGFCSMEEVKNIHKKMEALLGEKGAKLDGIYFCPHHPDKGFPGENLKYKIECDCRKPKIGMVKKAEKDFNIDLKHSYFVGDSFRDILCGRRAGMTTIGVKTGRGCRDGNIHPDFLFKNLSEAVNYIIKSKKYDYFSNSIKNKFCGRWNGL